MTRKKRDPLVVVGENVLRFRRHRNLNVKALAQLASLDRKTIFLIETGKHSATVATLTLLADALQVDTWMLLVEPGSWSSSTKFRANMAILLWRTSARVRDTLARFVRGLPGSRKTPT